MGTDACGELFPNLPSLCAAARFLEPPRLHNYAESPGCVGRVRCGTAVCGELFLNLPSLCACCSVFRATSFSQLRRRTQDALFYVTAGRSMAWRSRQRPNPGLRGAVR